MIAVLILGAVLTTTVVVEGMLVLIKLVEELLLLLALFKVATAEELSANAGNGCVPVTTRPGAVDGDGDAATTTLLLLIAVTCLT